MGREVGAGGAPEGRGPVSGVVGTSGTSGEDAAERLITMGLDFAIEELVSTGWSALDSTGCEHTPDGRVYPGVLRVQQEFTHAGFELNIRYVQLFDCHRAEWSDKSGKAAGAVVGRTEAEAAVYALAQLRRQTARVGA